MKTRLGINGAGGRMGRRLISLASTDPKVVLCAALEGADFLQLGEDAGVMAGVGPIGIKVVSHLGDTRLDVLVDFSNPDGTMTILPTCVARKLPIVIATTGHNHDQRRAIEEAAHETAVLYAPNTSLAINAVYQLVKLTGQLLGTMGFDVEILERHHRVKKDAPSGTAMHIAKILHDTLGLPISTDDQSSNREGHEKHPREIGVHALRVGDSVGEHTVIFSTLGETLELTHRAHSRDCYARGALQAAKFIASRPAGRYSMSDVLGL